jgi:hypothetical protein
MQQNAWLKTRERGRFLYILKWGVLGWGVPCFIAFTCLELFVERNAFYRSPMFLLLDGLIWCLCGYGSCWWMRRMNEKKYHDTTQ